MIPTTAEWGLASRLLRGPGESGPTKVTALLTERCHLRCDFCRLWENPDSGASTEEWLQVFRANPELRWVNLSGGEVFAQERLDTLLLGIVEALPKLALLDFPTAGQKPAQAERAVQTLLKTRLPRLVVSVSLDGGPGHHDRVRGVEGAFERGIETYQRLRKLQNRRFQVKVGCTLTTQAREQYAGLRQALQQRLPDFDLRELHFNLAHHSNHYYRNTEFTDLPDEEALQVLEETRFGWSPVSWLEWTYGRLARRALEEGFPPMGCTALRDTVFIGADLTVYPCSIWDRPLGNLRDENHSLRQVIEGLPARHARQQIDRKQCPGCFTPCESAPAMLARPWRSTWLALTSSQ